MKLHGNEPKPTQFDKNQTASTKQKKDTKTQMGNVEHLDTGSLASSEEAANKAAMTVLKQTTHKDFHTPAQINYTRTAHDAKKHEELKQNYKNHLKPLTEQWEKSIKTFGTKYFPQSTQDIHAVDTISLAVKATSLAVVTSNAISAAINNPSAYNVKRAKEQAQNAMKKAETALNSALLLPPGSYKHIAINAAKQALDAAKTTKEDVDKLVAIYPLDTLKDVLKTPDAKALKELKHNHTEFLIPYANQRLAAIMKFSNDHRIRQHTEASQAINTAAYAARLAVDSVDYISDVINNPSTEGIVRANKHAMKAYQNALEALEMAKNSRGSYKETAIEAAKDAVSVAKHALDTASKLVDLYGVDL